MNQIYRCKSCGNMVEMVHSGAGELVCCGQPMTMLKENSIDASLEKHMPVIGDTEHVIKIKVGAIAHPMEEKHYIEWIEIVRDDKVCRKFLKPGDNPEAQFGGTREGTEARAYCNLHGLWKA